MSATKTPPVTRTPSPRTPDGPAAEPVPEAVAGPLLPPEGLPPPNWPAPPAPNPIRTRTEETGNGFRLANFRQGDNERYGVPLADLVRTIATQTGGWPKRHGPSLFVPGSDGMPRWLLTPVQFMAWLKAEAQRERRGSADGQAVRWAASGDTIVTVEQLFAHLSATAEAFDDVQQFPHVPPRPRTWYHHPQLPAGGTGAFDRLLGQFRSATAEDAALVRAFFLTLAWGGPLGGRPLFAIETLALPGEPGQGSGKTTLAMLAGRLFGGFLSFKLGDKVDDAKIQTRLLSAEGRASRLVVFDNARGARLSSDLFASFVTIDVISGTQHYVGEGRRPNVITWCLTGNEVNLSKDFAQRVVPVHILPAVYAPGWRPAVERFIDEFRWHILADIAAILSAAPLGVVPAGRHSRFPDWDAEVLGRATADPAGVLAAAAGRRSDLDDDDRIARETAYELRAFIRTKTGGANPDTVRTRLTSKDLAEAVGKASPHSNTIATGRWVRTLRIPGLTYDDKCHSRPPWVWVGSDAAGSAESDLVDIPR